MSADLAASVIDSLDDGLGEVETIRVHLYGGEPLTNLPALEALVRRGAQKRPGRFRFLITTNGVGADQATLDLLDEGRFGVILSIDGPEPVHDELRRTADGAPTHAVAYRFLKDLRAHTNCQVRASAVVRSGWSLAQASDYLCSLPVDAVKAQAVRVPPGAPYELDKRETKAYFKDLEAIGHRVIADLEAGRPPRDDRFSSRVLQLLMAKERSFFCGAGNTTFGITPNGTVLPCVLIDPCTARLGNIDGDPSEWRREGKQWLLNRQLRPECRACADRPLCGGGCPALQPVCGQGECDLIRKNCDVVRMIFRHFQHSPERLLLLAGIS